ncbi:MAG: diguanylate cyclase [Candidatus Obscuribacterales bacterium]|nr:diguanylate cyclase [Candidatus Obscuribacterales bacterium]
MEQDRNQGKPNFQITALSGRESLFDKRLRELRNTGQLEKPGSNRTRFAKAGSFDFETPSMDSQLPPMLIDDSITEIERMAFIDETSGLLNKRSMLGKIEHELIRSARYKRSFCVMIVEFDNFESIESLTALSAEMQLQAYCRLLSRSVREVDSIGRFEKSSLIILCPETNLQDALIKAERLRSLATQARFKDLGQYLPMTLSLGIASYPEQATKAGELIDIAQESVQSAKARGGNGAYTKSS